MARALAKEDAIVSRGVIRDEGESVRDDRNAPVGSFKIVEAQCESRRRRAGSTSEAMEQGGNASGPFARRMGHGFGQSGSRVTAGSCAVVTDSDLSFLLHAKAVRRADATPVKGENFSEGKARTCVSGVTLLLAAIGACLQALE